jgi:hypothetical protein
LTESAPRPSLPSLEATTEIIADLKRIDLVTADIDSIKEQLRPLFTGYRVHAFTFDTGWPLYRGNVYSFKPRNSKYLRYPPPEKVNKFQRANRPGCPMFYCSGARTAPFFEVGVKPGDHISISRWRTTERALVNNIGYHDGVFNTLGSTRAADVYKEIMPEHDPAFDRNSANYAIHQFLAEEFAQIVPSGDEYRYKLSAAIAERLLGNVNPKPGREDEIPPYRKFCGIMYPSLAMRANADNIVLLPEFVDNHMTLEQVEYLHIVGDEGPLDYQYTRLDFANTFALDGTIQWKGRPPQWTIPSDGSVTPRDELGEIIYRDQLGNIVNPD